MNILLIVSDTVRRDYLGLYGNRTVQTPSLDALARESVVFDQAYSGSFPTIPCRAELFTGRFVFPYLDWGALPKKEVILSDTLAAVNYTCTMVTDNLPLCREGYGYDRGFHARHRIRGQWYDNLAPKDAPFTWPCPPEKLRFSGDGRMQQYLRNVEGRQREEEYFAPRVATEAMHWLENNHHLGKWFLYVDLFDPHEPWDPPQHYIDLYDAGGSGDNVIYPAFGRGGEYSEADMKRLRALYAGEVTMMDHWVGKLLAKVDELGHREDTVVAFLSDHGIFLGERNLLGKMGGSMKNLLGWPPYPQLSRVPLMVRAPGIAPGRREAFVHPGDVTPTLLELAGVKVPPTMNTASLTRVMRGQENAVRDIAVTSWSLKGTNPHRPSVIRNEEWTLVFWRSGIPPELYHRATDPWEERNVYDANRTVAAELHRKYVQFLREHDAGLRDLAPRLWLMDWDRRPRETLFHPSPAPSPG